VRIADGEPGDELQVDFGRMGLIVDAQTGRWRVVHALIFTACYSRHCFVWLSFRQTTQDVIDGFEAAWGFFGGVFATVIPDNLKAIVDHADALEPRLNQAFVEYAQARGFVIDPARVRSPQDKGLASHCTSWVVCDSWMLGWPAGLLERRDGGDFVEAFAFVVEGFADEAAFVVPGFDGGRADSEPFGEFGDTDPAAVA